MEMPDKVSGLILSAGYARRMGQLKPLLMLDNKPFLGGIIQKMAPVCQTIVVVTGYKSAHVRQQTELFLKTAGFEFNTHIKWCHNPAFKKGMFHSIQKGIELLESQNWTLLHMVDQPGLPAAFYSEFVHKISQNREWIQPVFEAKNGHPLLLAPKLRKAILEADCSTSLRTLKKSLNVTAYKWPCPYESVLQDIDTFKEYQTVLNKQF